MYHSRVLPLKGVLTVAKVPKEHIEGMIAARNLANELLEKKKPKDYAATVKLIGGAYDSLLSLDRSFCLEKEMLDNGQDIIDSAATANFMTCMPSEAKPLTLSQTQALLTEFKEQPCFTMASAAAQRKFECVQEIIANMQRAISPDPSITTGGPFYTTVLNRLALFMRCTDAKGKAVYGKAALDSEWKRMEAEMKKEPLSATLSDLEPFQCHKWLLSALQVTELSTWVCKVLETSQASSNTKATGSSSGVAGARTSKVAKAATKKDNKTSQGTAAVMKYF